MIYFEIADILIDFSKALYFSNFQRVDSLKSTNKKCYLGQLDLHVEID